MRLEALGKYVRASITEARDHIPIIVLVLIASFLIGASLGGAHVVGMVDRWQTLITGLFAVWAAFLTVRHMTSIDIEQGKRHRELVNLQLRADRLTVDRAAFPAVDRLKDNIDDLANAQATLTRDLAIKEIPDDAYSRGFSTAVEGYGTQLNALVTAVEEIRNLLNLDEIKEALPLFGSLMRTARTAALSEASGIRVSYEFRVVAGDTLFKLRNTHESADVPIVINNMLNAARDFVEAADDFCRDLDELDTEYTPR